MNESRTLVAGRAAAEAAVGRIARAHGRQTHGGHRGNAQQLDRMSALIARFKSAAKTRRTTALGRMDQFLKSWSQFQIERTTSGPPRFNVVEQSGLDADERQHSAILAWLLDGRGNHSMGNLFLNCFAQLLGVSLTAKAGSYSVRSEFPGLESIADVVIFRQGEVLIYIENKTFAQEGGQQLNRQERDLHRLGIGLSIPENQRCAVFLTPQGRKPVTGNPKTWRILSYLDLADGMERAASSVADPRLRCFVQDWTALLRKLNAKLC
jgi:hypothetical protein